MPLPPSAPPRLRPAALAALAFALLAPADRAAQPTASLAAYAGTYDYHAGDSLVLAPDPMAAGRLLAVIADARYPLRPIGNDRFLNARGDTIPFVRDAAGRVTHFVERGRPFTRRAVGVPPAVARALAPRLAADGRVETRYRYAPPAARSDGIPTGSLASAGIPQAPLDTMVRRVLDGTHADVDAVLLFADGRLVLEEYFHGTGVDTPHQLRSATKTVVALLAGIAIDEGRLPGDTARALPLLGDDAADDGDPRRARITLADLLTMRPGLACDDWDARSPGRETRIYTEPRWLPALFALPMLHEPGTAARYCSGGALAVGRIVERATGTPLPAYARRALFDPLGVRPADAPWRFALDSTAQRDFAQLRLRPRDLLKLGLLLRDGGRWRGRQVVSAAWVERMTARHTAINTRGYGYLVWHQNFAVRSGSATTRVATVGASGHGGQKLYVVPSLDAVVVFTGSGYGNDGSSAANALMGEYVLPALMERARRGVRGTASEVRRAR
jgi:CubicO group peptidase (beta-lactamase class C family)